MPEEAIINENQNQITYNVVIDPGDIARQAQEIRDQLDLALGVGSNAGAQFINTTQFINPQFASPPPASMTGFEGQFGGTFDQSFWNSAKDQVADTYNNFGTTLDKIQQDISRMLDRVTTTIQGFQPQPISYNPYDELLPDTFGENLLASIGFGGDLAGPIAPSVYQKYGKKRLQEDIEDILQNPGETFTELTSTPLGMAAELGIWAATGFNPIVGGIILGADVAALGDEFLSGAYNKREDLAGGIQEIARQQFGNISKIESRDIAQNVLEYVNSYEGYAKGITLDEVSQNILQFANEGGFAGTRNVEEMQERVTTVLEDTRQIARNLGIFQEEAVSIMAELQKKSMVNVEEMRGLTDSMRFYGGVLKQQPAELLMGAVQTAEQFRQAGSYLTPEMAIQTHVDANIEAQRLVQSTDPYIQSTVYRMGGQEGVTQGLLNAYNQFQQSPFANILNMGEAVGVETGDLNENILAGSRNFNNIDDWTRFKATEEERIQKDRSLPEQVLKYTQLAYSVWESLSPGQDPTFENLEGLMNMFPDVFKLTPDQTRAVMEIAKINVNAARQGKDPEATLKAGEIVSALRSISEDEETTVTGEIGANTMRYIDEFGREISYDYGEAKERLLESVGGDLYSSRITGEGKLVHGLFQYSPLEILRKGVSIITGKANLIDWTAGLPDDLTVKIDIVDEYSRRQIAKGRDSIVGQELSREMEQVVREQLVGEFDVGELNIGKSIDDVIFDINNVTAKQGEQFISHETQNIITYEGDKFVTGPNKEIYQPGQGEPLTPITEEIENRVNAAFGENTFSTEQEKYAQQMHRKRYIDSPEDEEYYSDRISKILENPELQSELKDKKTGKFLPFDQVVNKIAGLLGPPKSGMSLDIQKQLIWQAMGNQKDEKFDEYMIDEEEAQIDATQFLKQYEQGKITRDQAFKNMQEHYETVIETEVESLVGSVLQATGTLEEKNMPVYSALQETLEKAFEVVGKDQAITDPLAKRKAVFKYVRENFGKVGNYISSDEDTVDKIFETYELDTTLQNILFSDPKYDDEGRLDSNKRWSEASSKLNMTPFYKTIYDLVDQQLENLPDMEHSIEEISKAYAIIFPQMAADGEINLTELPEGSAKSINQLLVSMGEKDNKLLIDAYEKLSLKMDPGERKGLSDKIENLTGMNPLQARNDEEIGLNTRKIRDHSEEIVVMLKKIAFGDDVSFYYDKNKSGSLGY